MESGKALSENEVTDSYTELFSLSLHVIPKNTKRKV